MAELLTSEPPACQAPEGTPSARRGALMFSSPFLLGGQAAKAGLSCSSCHVNGRGNPGFFFAGISGAPGTADVTHGLFGPRRDDAIFNPVAIPDLAQLEGRKLDRRDTGRVLDFLRSQIADEFEGTPPSNSMLHDLAAYLQSLDASACPDPGRSPLRAEDDLQDAIDSYRASIDPGLPAQPDRAGYALAARHALGRLHARYPARQDRGLRLAIESVSRRIGEGAAKAPVLRDLEALRLPLRTAETRSLYSITVVADWLEE